MIRRVHLNMVYLHIFFSLIFCWSKYNPVIKTDPTINFFFVENYPNKFVETIKKNFIKINIL